MAAGDLQRGAAEGRVAPTGLAPMTTGTTIFALSSGAPPSAIAVIRIAGPAAFDAVRELSRGSLPAPRHLMRRTIVDADGAAVDAAMVAVFPGPASATGDDLAELHCHGSIAVVGAVLARLEVMGLTPAAPGDFTRRAFDHGKLDLGQVEALGDLLAAETDAQRRAALTRTGTTLAEKVARWRETLIAARANVEATLDFAEEEGVGSGLEAGSRAELLALRTELIEARAGGIRGGRLRDGVTIALVGPVNAGKSTLFNALARRDAAMVSPLPGTTRDVIEARIVLAETPVTLIDTAGLRDTRDELEAMGMQRGTVRAGLADLVIAVGADSGDLRVASKGDLTGLAGWHDGILHVSASTGEGIAVLEAELCQRIVLLTGAHEAPLVAHRWQMTALDLAATRLNAALDALDAVIIAEDLRAANTALERLVGRVHPDELLGAVFSRFCIGK